jgi:hypothetical protein
LGGVTPPNITWHPLAGIGGWSVAEIKHAIAKGGGRDGRALKLGMPFARYAGMNDADLDAIVARLRQVPPLSTPPRRRVTAVTRLRNSEIIA